MAKTPSGREVILLEDKSLRKIVDQENYFKKEAYYKKILKDN